MFAEVPTANLAVNFQAGNNFHAAMGLMQLANQAQAINKMYENLSYDSKYLHQTQNS